MDMQERAGSTAVWIPWVTSLSSYKRLARLMFWRIKPPLLF